MTASSGSPGLRVGILGAASYTGGELIRILLGHPRVTLAAVTSSTHPGQPVTRAHPQLRSLTGLAFVEDVDPEALDVLFVAGGHGSAMDALPPILDRGGDRLRVVDLSADFRLRDPGLYPVWYGRQHPRPDLLASFVYGSPELDPAGVARARRVANPGCFATAVELALGPWAATGAGGTVAVTAVTGSSGSGSRPSEITHHPTRAGSMKAYRPLGHQHVPEIEQALRRRGAGDDLAVAMVPVSGPFVRGIYAVCHLLSGPGPEDLVGLYRETYREAPFVRLTDDPPQINHVTGSNFCDLSIHVDGDRAVVIAAIDNLVKGAAGQAVQNMNLMMGWDQREGLAFAALHP